MRGVASRFCLLHVVATSNKQSSKFIVHPKTKQWYTKEATNRTPHVKLPDCHLALSSGLGLELRPNGGPGRYVSPEALAGAFRKYQPGPLMHRSAPTAKRV